MKRFHFCPWLVAALLLAACAPEPAPRAELAALQLQDVLGGEADEQFLRAEGRRNFRFPQDHGLHPGYRNEWWYFTGNLASRDGRRYGFQLTFFTHALPLPLDGEPGTGRSAWRSERLWMAHLAVTDEAGRRHLAFERFSRESLGLAGATLEPLFRVWLDDWQVRQEVLASAQPREGRPWLLQAAGEGVAVELRLVSRKQPVLQGENGLSRKSATPGNASWYYSLTRLEADGQLLLDGENLAVAGTAWLDREWSTSALDTDQSGWDWFSLQLDDGSELMYYQLRDPAGGAHPFSAGSTVAAGGERGSLGPDEVRLEELETWTAPNGVAYTTRWRLTAPGRDLLVEALLPDQWMDLSLPYWEGAVTVRDAVARTPLGRGYMEMVR